MIKYLNSKSNDNIKLLKSLSKKKFRDKLFMYVVEGKRIIEHGFENKVEFESIFVSEESFYNELNSDLIGILENSDINVFKLEMDLFKTLSETENSQGFMAIVKKSTLEVDFNNYDKILYVDRVQDPGNLGTIIRTADSSGIDCIVYNKGTVDPYNNKTVRSAMGSIYYMPIVKVEDDEDSIMELKSSGHRIITTSLDTDKFYNEIDYGQKYVIVVGNEGQGVSDEISASSDEKVKIPIYGKAESLNVAIATALILYEAKNSCYRNDSML